MTSRVAHSSHSRLLFDSPLVTVGRFDAAVSDPDFETAGAIRSRHHLVFPGTPVIIEQAGRRPFVADSNVVVLYNRDQEYRRRKLSEAGDHCCWVAFDDDVLLAALAHCEEAIADRPEEPFRRSHLPSETQAYLLHRLLVRHLEDEGEIDPMQIEETLLDLLGELAPAVAGSELVQADEPRPAAEVAERVK